MRRTGHPQHASRSGLALVSHLALLALSVAAPLGTSGCRRGDNPLAPPALSTRVSGVAPRITVSPGGAPLLNGARMNGMTRNGAATNGRLVNGCNMDGLPLSDLPEYPLSSESLKNVPSIYDSLCFDAARGILSYLVDCALSANDKLSVTLDDGETYEFVGDMGLATSWRNAPCDQACQEIVSSCITARGNYYGVHVEISMRAERGPPVLHLSPGEREKFPIQEGAFYGNWFAFPSVAYGCRGRGYDPYYQVVRRCAQEKGDCGIIRPFFTCDLFDGATQSETATKACEGVTDEGAFTNCHSRLSQPSGPWQPSGTIYTRPITIFTKHADFTPDGC